MKRIVKNGIMLTIVFCTIMVSIFLIRNHSNNNDLNLSSESNSNANSLSNSLSDGEQAGEFGGQMKPPNKPDGTEEENGTNQGTPPNKPNEGTEEVKGTNQGTPPEISGNMISGNGAGQGTPPNKPNEEAEATGGNEISQGTPPDMPSKMESKSGENAEGGEKGAKTEATKEESNSKTSENKSDKSKNIYYGIYIILAILCAVFVIYLIMSGFNKLAVAQTLFGARRKIIFAILTLALATILSFTQIYIDRKIVEETSQNTGITNGQNINAENGQTSGGKGKPGQGMQGNSSESSAVASATKEIDGTSETLNETYESTEADKSAILVKNAGSANIEDANINKSSGDSSNTENSEFYGINAGVLVQKASTATIKNSSIKTNAKGSNAVFSTGENSKIYISDSNVETSGSASARGLDATYGGYIEADNVTVKTQGNSSASLATDRGEGTVKANNSNLETNGVGSPVIYSTGNIEISNTQGVANNSQMVVIEGKNQATVTNSKLVASGKGNRNNVDNSGIMIYQSMSGDAGQGTGTFTAENSELTINSNSSYYSSAPMFWVTNTDAIINLKNSVLNYGSNILLKAEGTSEWGKTGSNGGNVTLNAENQNLNGDIKIDNISELTMNLTNSSSYEGTINSENTAKSITLKLDSGSKITLTGDSYVTSLEDADSSYGNINFNGYKLYVNGTAIN